MTGQTREIILSVQTCKQMGKEQSKKEWKVVGSEMPVRDELTNADRFKKRGMYLLVSER